MKIANVKIWVYHNDDYVKLTIKPNQRLSWGVASLTDEGWSSEEYVISSDKNGIITRTWVYDGQDCDGRYTRSGEDYLVCLDELNGITRALWCEIDSSVYDQYAQMAGY